MILTDFCATHGYNIFNIYVDDGFSGLNYNRPAFSQLLRDIDKGLINLVITKDLSRLGRDYIQTGYFTEVYFNQKGVRYIAVNDGIDTARDDNDIAPFKNILNDMYAKDLSRKIKMAKRQRANKGYYISSQTPFGYIVDPDDSNHLIIDEEAAETVRLIFKLAREEGSFSAISRKLSEMEVITPGAYKLQHGDTRFLRHLTGEKPLTTWSYQSVRTILLDKVYTGAMVNHKTEVINYKTKQSVKIPRSEYIVVPNMHEAIIPLEEFEEVQKIINARQRAKNHNFENIFKDRVFCAECGTPMVMIAKQNRDKSKKTLLKCFNHYINPTECTHYHSIIYEDLNDEVLTRIQAVLEAVKTSPVFEKLQEKYVEQLKTEGINDEN